MNHATPGLPDDGEEELMRTPDLRGRRPCRRAPPGIRRGPACPAPRPPRPAAAHRADGGRAAGRLGPGGLASLPWRPWPSRCSGPANAWAQVAKALQGLPWVHSRTSGPTARNTARPGSARRTA